MPGRGCTGGSGAGPRTASSARCRRCAFPEPTAPVRYRGAPRRVSHSSRGVNARASWGLDARHSSIVLGARHSLSFLIRVTLCAQVQVHVLVAGAAGGERGAAQGPGLPALPAGPPAPARPRVSERPNPPTKQPASRPGQPTNQPTASTGRSTCWASCGSRESCTTAAARAPRPSASPVPPARGGRSSESSVQLHSELSSSQRSAPFKSSESYLGGKRHRDFAQPVVAYKDPGSEMVVKALPRQPAAATEICIESVQCHGGRGRMSACRQSLLGSS
jgi:hypothetical protein